MNTVWKLVATLLVTAFVMHWMKWIVFVAALFLAFHLLVVGFDKLRARSAAERQRVAAISDRADQQHNWVMQGDERGVYGSFHAR